MWMGCGGIALTAFISTTYLPGVRNSITEMKTAGQALVPNVGLDSAKQFPAPQTLISNSDNGAAAKELLVRIAQF